MRDTTDLGSSYDYSAVTPSDTVSFSKPTRGIYVGVTGNVVAVKEDGTTGTWVGLAAGIIHPIRCIRVNSTSTTATSIMACF